MRVTALTNFSYPEDPGVRDKIRAFHRNKKNEGVGYPGDRGQIVEVIKGSHLFEAPEDLVDGWVERGLVEKRR